MPVTRADGKRTRGLAVGLAAMGVGEPPRREDDGIVGYLLVLRIDLRDGIVVVGARSARVSWWCVDVYS